LNTKKIVYQKYKEKVGEIISGEVYQVWRREILVLDDEGIELMMPKSEQIPTDFYRKGDTIRAVVLKVEMRNNTPHIILSRTSEIFLQRMFEAEVPEVYDGLITISALFASQASGQKLQLNPMTTASTPLVHASA
jgi:transcription termination/antitermination protein NusA